MLIVLCIYKERTKIDFSCCSILFFLVIKYYSNWIKEAALLDTTFGSHMHYVHAILSASVFSIYVMCLLLV